MKRLCVFLFLLTSAAWAASGYYLDYKLYLHTPYAFADRPMGFLPMDKKIPLPFKFNEVWYVRFPGFRPQQPMKEIAALVRDRQIPGLDFTGQRDVTDMDMPALADLRDLRYLSLVGTRVDDRGLIHLFHVRNLEVLKLSALTGDSGLDVLARMMRLEELGLAGSQVTDRGLANVRALTTLQRLNLSGTPVTDAGLKSLKALPLRQLHLGPKISDTGLRTVGSIHSLVQLNLAETAITDKGLKSIARLPLHTLFVGTSITDAGTAYISQMKSLRRLDLTGARVSDSGAQSLAALAGLEELALSRTQVGDAGLKALTALPRLRYLEISESRVSLKGIQSLGNLPALEVLSFSSSGKLTLGDLLPLGQLPKLHTVIINGKPLPPEALEHLRKGFKKADAKSLWDWLVPPAEAEDMNDALEVAQLTDSSGVSGKSFSGLQRIHYVESELDQVIPAPTMIGQDAQPDTEQNFLGEITVNSTSPRPAKPGQKTKKP